MRIHKFLLLLICSCLICSCEPQINPIDDESLVADTTITPLSNDTIIIGTGDEPGEFMCNKDNDGDEAGFFMPPSYLTLVRFADSNMKTKVIVQHPFKKIEEKGNYIYEYYDDKGLYMNIVPKDCTAEPWCGVPLSTVDWADEQLHIAGTSPYIPLAKDYYLIDWKWHQLFPLSAIAGAYPVYEIQHRYEDLLQNHVFVTDIDWKDFHNFSTALDASLYTQHVRGMEIIRVWVEELTCFYKAELSDQYACWNLDLYHGEGMCFDNMLAYETNGDCTHSGKTYRTYINYCDSLQDIYKQRLIELIDKGYIKKIGY